MNPEYASAAQDMGSMIESVSEISRFGSSRGGRVVVEVSRVVGEGNCSR